MSSFKSEMKIENFIVGTLVVMVKGFPFLRGIVLIQVITMLVAVLLSHDSHRT